MRRLISILVCLALIAQTVTVEAIAIKDNVNEGEISISEEENQQSKYECDFTYSGTGKIAINLGSTELISINASQLKLGGSIVKGTYGEGKYHLKAYINPVQQMTSLELTLPQGGFIKRGYYYLFGGTVITGIVDSGNKIENEKITYHVVENESYTYDPAEPNYSGFESKVYNLTTSFDDAETTRSFAWTTCEGFANGQTMAVKYRPIGTASWMFADAVKDAGSDRVGTEDYYKCDIKELTAGTTYEYKIGIKTETEEEYWGKLHSFSTAKEGIDEFSYIAIGDTQGTSWTGVTLTEKGYIYTQAAYRKAFTEVEDPAFLVHTGDVVDEGGDVVKWTRFFKALGGATEKTPMFATVGNHDSYGSPFLFEYHFNHPNNGGKSAFDEEQLSNITQGDMKRILEDCDETVYSYDYGNTHFVVLFSGTYNYDDMKIQKAQREWLINDLEANKDAKWKVIIWHKPVYHRSGGEHNNPWISDIIEDYEVDLVMQGHSHLVTRTYPMKEGKIVTKNRSYVIQKGEGTVYTTIGSTDPVHDGIKDAVHEEELATLLTPIGTQPAYTVVDVANDKLTVTTKQVDGLILDRFAICEDATKIKDTDVMPEPDQIPEMHKCSPAETKVIEASIKEDGKIETICTCGKVLSEEKIYKVSNIKLDTSSYTYNGKKRSPKIVVKNSNGEILEQDKDYNIDSPSGRKKIGKYTYSVNLKGNYSGTKELTLTIKPVKTTLKSLKSGKKNVTVKWKKASKKQISGYQVIVATNKTFTKGAKKSLVKNYKTVSKKITKLKAKKKYYVKVRTYKTVKVNGKNTRIYSNWSKVKTIKTR